MQQDGSINFWSTAYSNNENEAKLLEHETATNTPLWSLLLYMNTTQTAAPISRQHSEGTTTHHYYPFPWPHQDKPPAVL